MENDLAPEIARRRRAAWAAFSSIREVTDQVEDAGLRASIFNASILPAMCYATETWPDNKAVAKAMQTTHRALERCFMKTSLRQQWQQVQEEVKISLAGHLLRQKDDRWRLRVTEWLPRDHKRPLGRPPTRWADSFAKPFRKRSLPHWMQVAKDRAVWKSCGPR
ncbi:hypothetical protein Q1695_008512 [Nippostrongylus brasiliensis]|nr:hypothetical protein Q1695_008512 [Nippostrongylus brasiliensis]